MARTVRVGRPPVSTEHRPPHRDRQAPTNLPARLAGGKTQWLAIASTIWLTFYRVSTKRGSLLAHVTGIEL
jgi:hypothetical protein